MYNIKHVFHYITVNVHQDFMDALTPLVLCDSEVV